MSKLIKQIASVVGIALMLFFLLVAVTRGQQTEAAIATGGSYTLQKAVVAGGGHEKQQPPVGENGTAGQAVAGHISQGGAYMVRSGFWTPDDFGPTAAEGQVSGRVVTLKGTGIIGVRLTLRDADGNTVETLTNTFGFYLFGNVSAGETYTLTPQFKGYNFTPQVLMVEDDTEVNFVGQSSVKRGR
jgi:homospermidine synthase